MPKLYVVATPIGNLSDITPRMERALTECDLIAAEDTRVTMKLTETLGIKKPMLSCHRHNEDARADGLIARMLAEDLTVCLTCDAGTPGVSDPGQLLVHAAWDAGIPVIPICGPSAAITALSVSGFDAREFAFYGFLPRENKPLTEKLARILESGVGVCVFYESPHRVTALVQAIARVWPECALCVCCDLTKRYERIDRGSPGEVLRALNENGNTEKGEYCVVADIHAVPPPKPKPVRLKAELMLVDALLSGMDMEAACAHAAEAGANRNEIYKAKLAVRRLTGGD